MTVLLVLILAGTAFAAGKQESAAAAGPPIKIGAIFAETGGAANLGAPEAKTLRMLTDEINAKGGINGRLLEVIIKDSAASAEKAVSFTKQLIEEDQVSLIIGPTTSGETMQIKDICEKAGVPLLSCAAAEQIVNPVAKYVFKTPQNDSFVVQWIYKTMNEMGISNIGVVVANTGFGNAGKGQLEKYAPDFNIKIKIAETYDANATDLTALMAKVQAADIQAVVNWSIVPAQSIVIKNMRQLGMKQTLFQSHGFGNIKYVEAAGEAAEGVIFPCGRLLIANELPDSNPQKALLVKYKNDYESKYGEDVSTFGGHAYDAFAIAVKAIQIAGSDRAKLRDAIESITNFAGTAGIFNFSATDHNGLDMNSVEMLTV
ncbi:MAG: ABC transporter substrate-binding protein, partial [Spirochaetales bacterium]